MHLFFRQKPARARATRPPVIPRLEALEDRSLPSAGVLPPAAAAPAAVSLMPEPGAGSSCSSPSLQVRQSDGKIVVASGSPGGWTLARYNLDGSPDVSFGDGGKVVNNFGFPAFDIGVTFTPTSLALGPDGQILVVLRVSGFFAGFPTPPTPFAYLLSQRFNADGSEAATVTLQSGTDGSVTLHQPDGKTLTARSGVGSWTLARYNADGSPDTTFGNGGVVVNQFAFPPFVAAATYTPVALGLEPDGTIVAVVQVHVTELSFGPGQTMVPIVFSLPHVEYLLAQRFGPDGTYLGTFTGGRGPADPVIPHGGPGSPPVAAPPVGGGGTGAPAPTLPATPRWLPVAAPSVQTPAAAGNVTALALAAFAAGNGPAGPAATPSPAATAPEGAADFSRVGTPTAGAFAAVASDRHGIGAEWLFGVTGGEPSVKIEAATGEPPGPFDARDSAASPVAVAAAEER